MKYRFRFNACLRPARLLVVLGSTVVSFVITTPAYALSLPWIGTALNDAACNLLIPGTNGTSWNCVLNWTGGVAIPGASDIAVFNSSTTTNITIDTSISVAQLDIQAGYTGTITQAAGSTITVGSSGFSQAAGTFTGGNSAITINGPFSLSSGTFTATTGTTSITGAVTVSGGTFNHNSGLFTLSGTADQTINLGGKVLNNLTINNTGGGTSDDIVIANNSQLLLSGSLVVTLGNLDLTTNTEAMVVEKGITLADSAQATLTTNSNVTASGTILVNDAATITVSAGTWTLNDDSDQNIDLDGQSIFNLTLNDTGGGTNDDVIIAGGGLNLSGSLTVTLGNLDLTTNSQTFVTEKGLTLADTAQATLTTNSAVTASGTIMVNDAATITVTAGIWTLNDDSDQAVDLDGQSLFNLTLNDTGGGTNDDVIIAGGGLNLSGSLVVTLGNLDLTTNSQSLVTEKGLTLADSAQATLTTNSNVTASGTILVNNASTLTVTAGTWTLNDDGDQAVDLDGQPLFNLTINDTGGGANDDIVIAADSQLLLSGSLVMTLGNLDLSTNTEPLVIDNALTLANAAQSTLTTNTDITVGGNVTINDAATITTSAGTFTLNGTSDQTVDFDGQSVNNLTLNNSGGGTSDDIVIAAGSPLLLSGALTITLGNLDLATNDDTLVVERGITLADASQATFTTDQNITASGSILVNDSAMITITAGTLTLNDDGDQTVDLDGQSIFNLTLNNTGGGTNDDVIVNGGSLNLSGSLVVTLGNLDLSTNAQSMVAENAMTLANSAQATLITNSDMTIAGNILVNDAAAITVTAGTLTTNGSTADTTIDLDGQSIYNFTVANTTGGSNDDVIIAANSPLLISGSLVITVGNLDLATNTEPLVVEGSVTLANAAQATLTTNDSLTIGGNITVNDSATLTVGSATLTLNGSTDQAVDLDSQPVFNLVINNSGGGSNDDIVVAADSQILLSGSLVITLGNLDLATNTEAMIVEKGITLADSSQATLQTGAAVTASGTILVNDSATITVNAGTWTLNDDGDQSVDLDGQSLYNLTINNSGGGSNDDVIVAGGTLVVAGDLTVTLGNLDLDTNGLALDVDDDVTLAASSQATLSGSTMNIGGDILVASSATFTNTAGTVTLDGSSQSMSGALTFNNLTKSITSNDTLTFAATNTVTVRNTTTLQGTSTATLSLRSSQTGTQWRIDPQGSDTFLYLDIRDSNNINVTIASCPTNCTDSGNNTNWSIIAAVSVGGSIGGGGSTGGGGGGGGRGAGIPTVNLATKTSDAGAAGGGSTNTMEIPKVDTVLQQMVLQKKVCDEQKDNPALLSRNGFLSTRTGNQRVIFKDVPVNAWFALNVHALTSAGVASGYKDADGQPTGLFGAANMVTYAELIKMILETTQETLPATVTNRPQNASAVGHWSERYMKFAEDLGLSVYKPDLDVNANASRGDVIKTLMEAFDIPMDTQMAEYSDLDDMHPYTPAISTATRLCIIRGDTDSQGNLKGTVRPDDSINRAEVSEIIQRILVIKP